MSNEKLTVIVKHKYPVATDISCFELVDPEGRELPEFNAGEHVDVHIKDMVRQYSLSNSPSERQRYVLGIKRETDGRGGSKAMHDLVNEGDEIEISLPRNNFHLDETADYTYLFAGGIGITPILSMAQRLHELGKPFEFHYCCRSEGHAAFKTLMMDSGFSSQVHFHFDDGDESQKLKAEALLKERQGNAHLYVCGPQAFMDHVIDVAENKCEWPNTAVHLEYFSVEDFHSDDDGAFQVKIASTGNVYDIPADKTIIEVLEENGVSVSVSCEQGVCGTCLTGVVEGEPDHRDVYMTDDEKAKNDQMTICCSRSRSSMLVLDL